MAMTIDEAREIVHAAAVPSAWQSPEIILIDRPDGTWRTIPIDHVIRALCVCMRACMVDVSDDQFRSRLQRLAEQTGGVSDERR